MGLPSCRSGRPPPLLPRVSETGGGAIYEWKNDTAPPPGPQWSQQYRACRVFSRWALVLPIPTPCSLATAAAGGAEKNLVAADASFLAGSARVSGLTLWQFSDIKANDAGALAGGSR